MKRLFVVFLTLLLGSSLMVQAQVTQLPDRQLYRGADYSFNLVIGRSDSVLASTATLYYDRGGVPLKPAQQPALTRSGQTLKLAWSAAKSADMITGKYWLEISAGSSVRYAAWLYADKNPKYVTPPGSLTVVSPLDPEEQFNDLLSQLFIYLFE